MKVVDLLYSVTTGPERRRRLLAPFGLAFALGLLALVVVGSLFTDRALSLPRLLPGALGTWLGLLLLGLGFILGSPSLVVVGTPAFALLNLVELKVVEEPELERRFGARYTEYRQRIPMFIPRRPRAACAPGERPSSGSGRSCRGPRP